MSFGSAHETGRFPTLKASDLDGREYEVPAGLPAGPKVVLLGFKRWHQVLLAMWQVQLRSLERDIPTLGVWQLTALPRTLVPAGPLIKGGLKASARDPELRRHVLAAYTDIDDLAAALGLEDLNCVYALLLGPEGDVIWRAEGKPSTGSVAALAEVLAWAAPGA